MKIKVRVVPRAKKERIEKIDDGLKVHICEPAIEGRANKKLIELLADYFHTKKYKISIVLGQKQKDKVVQVDESSF